MYTVLSVSKLFEVDCLHQHCFGPVAIAWIGMECCSNFLCILITVMYFKDRNWISKILNCISCSVVCKIVFCSEFPDIRDNAGKVTRRRRRRTQTIAKRYAFHANVIKKLVLVNKILWCFDLILHLVLRLNMVNSFLVSLESPVMINILYEMIKILHEKMLNAIYFYWFQKYTSEKNN